MISRRLFIGGLILGISAAAPGAKVRGPKMMSSITSGLVFFAKLDGNGNDAVGSNNLTLNGSPTTQTGDNGSALYFTGATEYANHADNATVTVGGGLFTITCKTKLITKTASSYLVGKWGGAGNYEFLLYYDQSIDRLRLAVTSTGLVGSLAQVTANTYGSPGAGWIRIAAWYDGAVIGIYAADGVTSGADTLAFSAGVFDGTSNFTLGRNDDAAVGSDCFMDDVGIWKRVLNAGERTRVTTAGATYPTF